MMKKLGLVLTFALLIALFGCGSGGGDSVPTALTENDFGDDPDLRADFQETVVMFLEDPTDQEEPRDTGEMGVDVIPYYCEEEATYSFCWEDDDPDAQHYMILEDGAGNELMSVYANGECVTEVIEVGHYTMYLYDDDASSESQALFIRPDSGEASEGDMSLVQTGVGAIRLLISHECVLCDLNLAVMPFWQLSGVDLRGAVLTDATLIGTNLSGADLDRAVLFRANLTWANLSRANLNAAHLDGAYLTWANLTGANLYQTSLMGANLSGATWTDGRTCAWGSIGKCN
jgi:hypothetical protein